VDGRAPILNTGIDEPAAKQEGAVVMTNTLTFAIYPVFEVLAVETLVKTIDDVHRLVKNVDYAVTGQRDGRAWIVDRLQSSTPTITIRPALDEAETTDDIVAGLRVLMLDDPPAEPPAHFSAYVLDELVRLRARFGGRNPLQQIVFTAVGQEPVTVTPKITTSVERLRGGGLRVLGSVEGTLDVISLRGKPSVTIWDRVTNKPVRCWLPKDRAWLTRAKELLGERVLVSGRVQYYPGRGPYSIDQMSELRSMAPEALWPRAGFGSVPNLTGGEDTMTYLRRTRE
jgi:hypothetical protein